ncbi:hypothetical protein PMG11_06270 [Penicillium brasilianum]|uniref:BTB domain-containing protein n=1 Tax=Penicillium brasilianum TaxID=104259 RepID=A0A0F7TNZ7_PENBI|nr:hypothetical protein PMG11_06270 [Penicillium brasilianum]
MQDSMDLVIEAVRGLPTKVIDPDGDATLILSSRQYRRLFLCSSQRLISTCGHFRKKLAEGGQPHTELMRDKKVYLTISDFDPKAVEIILSLIHGRIDNIPRMPDFPLLLDLARFCRYLQCLPALKPFANSWMNRQKNSILATSALTADSHSLMFISLTFRHQEVFRHITAIFQQNLADRMDLFRTQPLVPKEIIKRINAAREAYLNKLSRLLYAHHKRLSRGPPICTSKCDKSYSNMMIEISASGLLPFFQQPNPRYTGYVPKSVRLKLLQISSDNFLHTDRVCPHGKGPLCPNYHNPLGVDVENHLWQFAALLPGADLPVQE